MQIQRNLKRYQKKRWALVTAAFLTLTVFKGYTNPLTSEEISELKIKVTQIWDEHLKNTKTLEETLRKNPQTTNPTFPTKNTTTLKTQRATIPITVFTTTYSKTPEDKIPFLVTGLTCPIEVLPNPHPNLTEDSQFLVQPNTKQAQLALSLGYPTKVPYSNTFNSLKKNREKE